jgi:Tfp pilus assembly protein PilV
MLRRWRRVIRRSESGDTLVEVSVALALLSFVLLSSTALTADAFRTGQLATARLQVASVAEEQLEALRSFRDNNDWNTFSTGVDAFPAGFHMVLQSGASTQWVPSGGAMTTSTSGSTLTVPTSTVEISSTTRVLDQLCGFDFTLIYSFVEPGDVASNRATGTIETRLADLKYDPLPGHALCP